MKAVMQAKPSTASNAIRSEMNEWSSEIVQAKNNNSDDEIKKERKEEPNETRNWMEENKWKFS